MNLSARLRDEWGRATRAARQIDAQTAFVLVAAVALALAQFTLGSRRLFHAEFAHLFAPEWQGVLAWGYWFSMQGVLGFVVPVLCLRFLFRQTAAEMGLGLGDWKLASGLAGLYLPLVVIGTWVLSDSVEFQEQYPHYAPAATDWRFFVIYEALFIFYWIGWEYLWRGFVLFGTARTFGLYSIFVQMVPFAILHFQKPLAEALLSIVGGLALGALVWRCRSFWIAVPLHAAQMLILDLWCSLRIRTGVEGVGPGALLDLLRALGGA